MSDAMLGSELDGMVQRYLGELATALQRLPGSRRDHLVGEIREHITELRSERPVRDRSDMEALLNRVGLPEDIAAVALEDLDLDENLDEDVAFAPEPPRRRTLPSRAWVLGAVVAFVGLAAVSQWAFDSGRNLPFPEGLTVNPPVAVRSVVPAPPRFLPVFRTVPNVTGESEAEARASLQAAGLPTSLQLTPSANVPSGTVVAQDPSAGSSVARGTDILIFVSSGPPLTGS